jgi:hypothetical protein
MPRAALRKFLDPGLPGSPLRRTKCIPASTAESRWCRCQAGLDARWPATNVGQKRSSAMAISPAPIAWIARGSVWWPPDVDCERKKLTRGSRLPQLPKQHQATTQASCFGRVPMLAVNLRPHTETMLYVQRGPRQALSCLASTKPPPARQSLKALLTYQRTVHHKHSIINQIPCLSH